MMRVHFYLEQTCTAVEPASSTMFVYILVVVVVVVEQDDESEYAKA